MPTAPPRACPHCGRLRYGGAPCPAHPRPSAVARGYDQAWATYSKAWLARFPWCGMRQDGAFHGEHSRCVQRGLRVNARCTDHIIPLRSGGERLDPANHQSLCASCNIAKIAKEG